MTIHQGDALKRIPLEKAAIGVIEDESLRILVCRRGIEERFGGLWEFPGGRVEDDETLEECLERELDEELHVQALVGDEIFDNRFDYGDFVVELHFFKVRILSGEVHHHKGREFRWVELMELPTLDFIPGSVPFIDWARLNL